MIVPYRVYRTTWWQRSIVAAIGQFDMSGASAKKTTSFGLYNFSSINNSDNNNNNNKTTVCVSLNSFVRAHRAQLALAHKSFGRDIIYDRTTCSAINLISDSVMWN